MTTNGKPKFEGTEINMGGTEYVVPSLSVVQAKKYWSKIMDINTGVTVENLPSKYDDIVEVIHAALSRNYPELKIEDLMELVDLSNIRRLQLAVMGNSGVLRPGAKPAVAEIPVSE